MKDEKERRKHTLVVVAIVGAGGITLFVLANAAGARAPSARAPSSRRSTASSRSQAQPSRHTMNFAPNPANPSLEASILAAREAAINTYDQSAVAERGQGEQYQLGLAENATAKAVAFNQTAAQLKEASIQSTAYETIAQEEEAVQRAQISAQESVASQEASAQQTQASGGFWGSILGGIGSILPFLGL